MKILDRVKELRRVKAKDLKPNPRNWRLHPQEQWKAVGAMMKEIGYADALLARALPDGSLELLDGHLRAEITSNAEVPVLILDITEAEAEKLLVLLDPIKNMAIPDKQKLAELAEKVETQSGALQRLLDEKCGAMMPAEVDVPALNLVVVKCLSKFDAEDLVRRLRKDGFNCRIEVQMDSRGVIENRDRET